MKELKKMYNVFKLSTISSLVSPFDTVKRFTDCEHGHTMMTWIVKKDEQHYICRWNSFENKTRFYIATPEILNYLNNIKSCRNLSILPQ